MKINWVCFCWVWCTHKTKIKRERAVREWAKGEGRANGLQLLKAKEASRPTTIMSWSVGFRSFWPHLLSWCDQLSLSLSVLCVYIFPFLYIFWTRNKTVHILSLLFFSSILRLFVFSLSKWFTGIRLLCVYMHFSSRSKICRKLKIPNSWSLLFELLHSTLVYSIFNLYTWTFSSWLKIIFDFLLWTWSDRLWEKNVQKSKHLIVFWWLAKWKTKISSERLFIT